MVRVSDRHSCAVANPPMHVVAAITVAIELGFTLIAPGLAMSSIPMKRGGAAENRICAAPCGRGWTRSLFGTLETCGHANDARLEESEGRATDLIRRRDHVRADATAELD